MSRTELRRQHLSTSWTTLEQRRGALIVLVICVLLAAAITAVMMRMDRVPARNAAPKPVDEVAMLRAERAALEQMSLDPTAPVTLGW